jgi:hypothetical protein
VSRDDFIAEYRPEMLLLLAEAWAIRNESRTEVGACLERHHVRVKRLLNQMYDALYPEQVLPLNQRKQP